MSIAEARLSGETARLTMHGRKYVMVSAHHSRCEKSGSIFIISPLSLIEVILGLLCSVMMISLFHNVSALSWHLLLGELFLCVLVTMAALWWRLAGLLFLVACGVLSSFGCAGRPDHSESSGHIIASQRYDEALRTTRAEATALRSDMAATRIAAAKKEAEFQELRRQLIGLRQIVETKQSELQSLREERDHLLQSKSDYQIQLAEVPQLRQSVVDARAAEAALQRRLKDFETALTTLSADIAQVKKELDEVKTAPQVQRTKAGPAKGGVPLQALPLPLNDRTGAKEVNTPLKKLPIGAP